MVLSKVDQTDKHQEANQELSSDKPKQYMTKTQRRNQTEQQGLTETAPKAKHSMPQDTQKTNGQQSLSKGAPQKQCQHVQTGESSPRRLNPGKITHLE